MEQKLNFKPFKIVKMAPETYAVIEALAHKEGITRIEAARRLINRTIPIDGDGLFQGIVNVLKAEVAYREEVYKAVGDNHARIKDLFTMLRTVRDQGHNEIVNAYNQRAELEKMMIQLVGLLEKLQSKIGGL